VGLNELVASLIRNAETEAGRRRAAARAEAERLVADARARVAGRVGAAVREREAALRRELRHELARDRQARRAARLERRDRLLARVFALTLARLPEVLDRPRYRHGLARDLSEARAFLDGREAVVRAPATLQAPIAQWLAEHPGWAIVVDEALRTGPVIESRDGRLTLDLSLETRLRARWDRLAQHVARWLATPP
jgi:vacuolar-type H+-ATPase subunit E/Vma4